MPEEQQQPEPIQLPPLDPGKLLQRVEKYNPDLYYRIIAEEQREILANMVQNLTQPQAQQSPQVNDPEIADVTAEELDLNKDKDAA